MGCAVSRRAHQRLHLYKEGTQAVKHHGHCRAAEALVMNRHKHFGRIGNVLEARSRHLEYSQLRGGAKAVLDAAKQAVGAFVVAFELQHNVYYVLQNLRTCNVAVLGNMSDKNNRNSGRLCKV